MARVRAAAGRAMPRSTAIARCAPQGRMSAPSRVSAAAGIAADHFASLGGGDLRAGGAGDMLRAIWNPAAQAALAGELADADPDTTLIILHQWTRYLSPAALRVVGRFPAMIYMHDYFWPCPNGLYYDFQQAQPCTRRPMHAACLTANCDRQGRVQKLGRVARQAVRQIATHGDPGRRLFLHLSEHAQRTAAPLLQGERHAILYNPLPLGEAWPPPPHPGTTSAISVGWKATRVSPLDRRDRRGRSHRPVRRRGRSATPHRTDTGHHPPPVATA
ncbi:hypothetical protein P0F65_10225 [Sphingomonas sp. I4]